MIFSPPALCRGTLWVAGGDLITTSLRTNVCR